MTINEETTVSEPIPPRELTELLSLGTYQGMTDEEIDIVIDYKIQRALDTDEQAARRDAAADVSKKALETTQHTSEVVADMIESIKGTKPKLIRVTGDGNE